MNSIVDKINRIKYLRMDKNERRLSYYFSRGIIVPYEHNKDRVFYKVNGKVLYEYNTREKIICVDRKIWKCVSVDKKNHHHNNNIREIITTFVSKNLNRDVVNTTTRDYKTYKLWRDLSDDV